MLPVLGHTLKFDHKRSLFLNSNDRTSLFAAIVRFCSNGSYALLTITSVVADRAYSIISVMNSMSS